MNNWVKPSLEDRKTIIIKTEIDFIKNKNL